MKELWLAGTLRDVGQGQASLGGDSTMDEDAREVGRMVEELLQKSGVRSEESMEV